MLKVLNMGCRALKKYIQDKKVYVYGAGRALESCLDIYFSEKSIENIVDANPQKWGRRIAHNGDDVEIISPQVFAEMVNRNDIKNRNCLLMIASTIYAGQIVEQLDNIEQLDGLPCCLQILVRNTYEGHTPFEFTKGRPKIPKKIHYFWVGGNPISDEYKKNIETWKKYNPDYEIIRWDESNYDISKNEYTKQTYETKAWAFFSNYARLDVVYRYGGIYLDIDVEAIKSFDCLLNDNAFLCMGSMDRINMGCGFGAVAEHPIIKQIMQEFEHYEYIADIKRPFHAFVHPVVRNYRFEIDNRYQKINDVVLYPKDVMSPLCIDGMEDCFSENTVSIHKESGSWKSDKEKELQKKLQNVLRRTEKDWI